MQKNPFVFKIKQKGFLRAVALFLTVCLLFSGMPVSAAAASEDEDHGYVDLDAKSVTFKKGKVLLKEKDFSITTKDIYTRDNGFIIVEVTIQNMGKKSLDFWTDYCVINGYNVYSRH